MAIDRRITDLDSIVALSTGDLFLVTDADQSNIAKNADIDIITSYVVARVPSSARAFGGGVNEIAQWAEGNNVDQIPAAKIPTNAGVDLTNYVTLDTTQVITGIKNFTNLLSDSQEVVTIGNPQTITGIKTLASPTLTGLTSVNTIHFPDGSTQDTAFSGGGDVVTKATVDAAIGAFPTGDSAQFYNQQGNFVDANYDSLENQPIIRNATVERIIISGTRSNVVVNLPGVNEFSTITMDANFDPTPTQYTSVFNSPNTNFTPSPSVTTSDIGRQFSLTESDGTEHIFIYLTNGNFRYLADGITGTLRKGTDQIATTASTTGTFAIGDQAANQTITLAGDQRSQYGIGDFISKSPLSGQAFRGMFIESVTINGSNTDLVGTGNGGTSFSTSDTLYVSAAPSEILGTTPTFSYDPDTANTVYTNAALSVPFTNAGVGIAAHLQQIGAAIAALDTDITFDGVVTDNGNATSSITIDLGTETNINSSFTLTGGLNNMETLVNTDGASGGTTPSTTITLIDPEATEVVSFTSSVSATTDDNIADIANQIVGAVNGNVETPINFNGEYDSATNIIILTAEEAGNTNLWSIIINNNGATAANAGNLGYTSSQTGEVINQIDRITTNDIEGVGGVLNLTADVSSTATMNPEPTGRLETPFTTSGTITVAGAPALVRIVAIGSYGTGDNSYSGELVVTNTSTSVVTTLSIGGTNMSGDIAEFESASLNAGGYTYTLTFTGTNVTGEAASGIASGGSGDASLSLVSTAQDQTATLSSSKVVALEAETVNINATDRATFTVDDFFDIKGGTIDLFGTGTGQLSGSVAAWAGDSFSDNLFIGSSGSMIFNASRNNKDFRIFKQGSGEVIFFDASADNLKIDADTIEFTANTITGLPSGGADGLSITDTVNLNLLDGTTVLSTVTLPSSSGTTIIAGTANEIINTVSGDTNTLSLAPAITGAITANTAKTGITTAQASAITTNTGKTGITVGQSNAIIANTAKTGITTIQSDAIVANTSKVGITTAQATAITNNTAKTGITTAQATAITNNTAKNSYPTADSTKLAGIEALADVTDTDNVVSSLTAGNNITISAAGVIAATAGGTSTTVLGTANEIDVNTVGSNATVSLSSTITDAIDLNTAKVSVAGLNQVGAAVLSTDSVVYYAGTALAPRRKVFSSVPLSIMNNDANFITGITKANVDTAIGTGGATTDYYASDKTWKTIPSGGGGDAVLANTQTFTGVNTFNNAAGGIQASRITGIGDTDTSIDFATNNINLITGGNTHLAINEAFNSIFMNAGATVVRGSVSGVTLQGDNTGNTTFRVNDNGVLVNGSFQDINFIVNKRVSGIALSIDSGSDAMTIGSDVLTINSTTINGLPSKADALSISGQVLSLLDGTTVLDTVTLPTSSGASLTATQTFTGRNTFSDTAIFSDTSTTDGSLQVAGRIIHQGDTDTYLDFPAANSLDLVVGGVTVFDATQNFIGGVLSIGDAGTTINASSQLDLQRSSTHNIMRATSTETIFNTNRLDRNFVVYTQTSGSGLSFDAGTATLSSDAINFEGIADQERGVWVPAFINAGTQGTTTATYARAGDLVTLHCEAELAAGTSTSFIIQTNSFPFGVTGSGTNTAAGTWFTSATDNPSTTTNSGVVALQGGNCWFLDNVTNSPLPATGLRGYLGLTITYLTIV